MQVYKPTQGHDEVVSKIVALMMSSNFDVRMIVKCQIRQLIADTKKLRFTLDKTGNAGVLHDLETALSKLCMSQSRMMMKIEPDRDELFNDLAVAISHGGTAKDVVEGIEKIHHEIHKYNINIDTPEFNEIKRALLDLTLEHVDCSNGDMCPFCGTECEDYDEKMCPNCGCCWYVKDGWNFIKGGSYDCNHLALKFPDHHVHVDSIESLEETAYDSDESGYLSDKSKHEVDPIDDANYDENGDIIFDNYVGMANKLASIRSQSPRRKSSDIDYESCNSNNVHLPTPDNPFRSSPPSPIKSLENHRVETPIVSQFNRGSVTKGYSLGKAAPSLKFAPTFKPSFKQDDEALFLRSRGSPPSTARSFSKMQGCPRVYKSPSKFASTYEKDIKFPLLEGTPENSKPFRISHRASSPGTTRNSSTKTLHRFNSDNTR